MQSKDGQQARQYQGFWPFLRLSRPRETDRDSSQGEDIDAETGSTANSEA
jgi:hypothetical protein